MRLGYEVRRLTDVGRALLSQRALVAHDRWSAGQLRAYQERRLRELLAYAVRHSPFYRDRLGGLGPREPVALQELPPLTKATLMEHFDDVVTDRRIRLADLQRFIAQPQHPDYYRGRFVVLPTAGSSGMAGMNILSREEWVETLANNVRLTLSFTDAHRTLRLPRRRASCVVSGTPYHLSYVLPRALDVGVLRCQMLAVTTPLPELVRELNAFRPEALIAYPSVAALLAVEHLEGRLHIRPELVSTGSEMLTPDMAARIKEAWGLVPLNVYGITETGGPLGCECVAREGLHLFEDRSIVEIVDDRNRPVPPGVPGHKVLVTNLTNRLLPLIRYEVSDMLTEVDGACSCGRAFRRVRVIDGRNDEILFFRSATGERVAVHPVNFWGLMAGLPDVTQYQFVHEPTGLRLRVVLRQHVDQEAAAHRLRAAVRAMIEARGAACPPLTLQFADALERVPQQAGKLRTVKSNVPA